MNNVLKQKGLKMYPEKTFMGFAAGIIASVVWAAGATDPFVLARRGDAPRCAIIVAKGAGAAEKYAAMELQAFTKRMTDVELPVFSDDLKPAPGRAVVIGVDAGLALSDGFTLKVDSGKLHVTGGCGRGALYGVYEVLSRFGGCDWFAPWCETVPERTAFEVPGDLDVTERPAFDERYASWCQVYRGKGCEPYAGRLRFNRNPEPQYGGRAVKYAKGLMWDNAISRLVPPKEHFAAHPEWYSEINGRRIAERAQVCYSNPELIRFVVARVSEILLAEPDANAISIAQNDCGNYCRCVKCEVCTQAEGSAAGPNIRFANAVAEEVEKEFPNVLITTFAYQWSRHPPKHIRPRHNVMVVLCSFECSFARSFVTSDHANTQAFRGDLKAWGAVCNNLRIYDYCTNFRNFLYPFPNLYSMGPNYRLFRDSGVRWLGSQGGGSHSEFAALKAYLQSRLMWNPDQKVDPLIDRFLKGYYGAAAPLVRRYIDQLYAALGTPTEAVPDPEGDAAWGGIYAEATPLTEAFLDTSRELWAEAEAAVKDDPVRLFNVRMSAMPILYVQLKRRYETGHKTIWVAEDIAPHVAGMEAIKPLAADLLARMAEPPRRGEWSVDLAEDWETRHKVLMRDFKDIQTWRPPTAGCAHTVVSTNQMIYARHNRTWRLPVREIAVDEGAKYRVRVHLKPTAPDPLSADATSDVGFVSGLDVEWLPHAKGTHRVTFAKDKLAPDWTWYDVGTYDFSEIQNIPRPTLNGLCLIVQGDVELDKLEITKVGENRPAT